MNFNEIKNLRTFILTLQILLPIIILVYVFYILYTAFYQSEQLKIDFNKENFNNSKKSFYIDENYNSIKFSSFGKTTDAIYTEIRETPINFVWKTNSFSFKQNTSIEILFIGSGLWEHSAICEEKTISEQKWKTFYIDEFSKDDYFLTTKYNNSYIYSNKDKNYIQQSDIKTWLTTNVNNNANIKILNEVINKNDFINTQIKYNLNSSTTIKNKIKGEHEFLTYLENNLDLTFKKVEINDKGERKELFVEIKDLNDNVLLSKEFKNNDLISTTTSFNLSHKIESSGIYKIVIKEKEPKKSNWYIQDLSINSNKLIIASKSNYVLDNTILYTTLTKEQDLGFLIWNEDALQTISIYSKNYSKILTLTKNDLNNWKYVTLPAGEYQISSNGGVRITGNNLAFSKEAFFNPYIFNFDNFNQADFIITDFHISKEKNWNKTIININTDEYLDCYKNNKLQFAIRNKEINKKNLTSSHLLQNGFMIQSKYNYYQLYTKNIKNVNEISKNGIAWINNNINDNSILLIQEDALNDLKKNTIERIKDNINIYYIEDDKLSEKSNFIGDYIITKDKDIGKHFIKSLEIEQF